MLYCPLYSGNAESIAVTVRPSIRKMLLEDEPFTHLPSYSDYEIDSNDLLQIRALSSVLALMLAAPSTAQTTQVSEFVSPCPNVFTYEPLTGEENKWYGTVNLTTDTTLYALWLDIVLDNKANILGVSLFISFFFVFVGAKIAFF